MLKLNGSKGYILTYDMCTSGKYQFTCSEDSEHFKVVDEDVPMNFHQRHGTTISITNREQKRLEVDWNSISRK